MGGEEQEVAVDLSKFHGCMQKGKGHAAFATWPLLMPATTYSPTHFRVQYNRPCGA
jgi:hypothetical protein